MTIYKKLHKFTDCDVRRTNLTNQQNCEQVTKYLEMLNLFSDEFTIKIDTNRPQM